MFIYSYNFGSKSAKLLSEQLGAKRIKHIGSKFIPKGSIVINWGASTLPFNYEECELLLNSPEAVDLCSDKIKFFENIYEEYIPAYTLDKEEAIDWTHEGDVVVCRTVIRGHSGDGIVIASSPEEVIDAPLYTLYFKKRYEYRIHIMNGRIIFTQRKAKKNDAVAPNWKVRTLNNGFVFVEEDVLPARTLTVAKEVFAQTGLDFGAVDILYNERHDTARCVEVNTAPGMEERTASIYAQSFKQYYDL